MAGYLGTLFMANVGMRLLLPPKSEFTKASTNFGAMVGKISGIQRRYFSEAGKNNVRSLGQTLRATALLGNKYGTEASKKIIETLSSNLTKIASITNSRVKQVGKNAGATFQMANRFNRSASKNLSSYGPKMGAASFAKKYAGDLDMMSKAMARAEVRAARMTANIIKGADAFANMGAYLLGTFRNALAISVTMLTTLGYTIKGLSQDFAEFEKQLINANSIWQEQNEVLYEISDRVVKFGEDYGVAYENAGRVLYQFASAGLEAAEAQAVLNDVLLLSMAVQGDANTIGKLTVQTIKGFGLEMSDSTEVTDKFAHAINASLIEYQDLAAAIKFALPFFAATNQNLDQLLGSIQILTDRALEAGIAGRGLRQALAEFAEGAEDSTRKMHEMGVSVTDANGDFLKMTEIARNFANVVGTEVANDTELLTALIEDLNIRGATAFIHLVQNVDEFEEAVSELANSQGASNKMAEVQQGSLVMQIQLLRNAAKEVFYLSEAQYVANGYMNEFDFELKQLVSSFKDMFIIELADGSKELTQFSYDIRNTVIVSLQGFREIVDELVVGMIQMTQQGYGLADMARMLFMPIKALTNVFIAMDNVLGAVGGSGALMKFYFLSMIFGQIGAAAIMAAQSVGYLIKVITGGSEALEKLIGIGLMVSMFIPGVGPVTRGGSMMMKGARGMKGLGTGRGLSVGGYQLSPGKFLAKRHKEGIKSIMDDPKWLKGGTAGLRKDYGTGIDWSDLQDVRSYKGLGGKGQWTPIRAQIPAHRDWVGGRYGGYGFPKTYDIKTRELMPSGLGKYGLPTRKGEQMMIPDVGEAIFQGYGAGSLGYPQRAAVGASGVYPRIAGKARPDNIKMMNQTTFDMFTGPGGKLPTVQEMWMAQEGFPTTMFGLKGGASARGLAVQKYSDEFARYWGSQYFMGGMGGVGAGAYIYGNAGGNNYAYDSYMAQMRTSSNYGAGGQDLYVENAYIESNNFQDLFYNSDNLGT